MNDEANADGELARRAALHAALADPGRLAIVDTLAWSESSPSELAARQLALVYLFTVLYGLSHMLISMFVPDTRRPETRRWMSGLIGAAQAGTLATLAVTFLPQA